MVSDVGEIPMEKLGGGRLMVKAAEAMLLFEYPEATAIAWMVSEVETVMAVEYCVELAVGVVPSVV
jgi:hypothetical protein